MLSLIPLIIIYLKKPKPRHMYFPSLEFLMKRERKRISASWLSRILDDPLFLLQLLILAILSLAVAYPYFPVSQTIAAEEAVIIIDVSGSMQASLDGTTRLERAKQFAEESLAGVNTVILAADFPEVLAEKADKGSASRLIRSIRPRATVTNLYDSMILGDDYMQEGKVVVISDFLHNANSKSLATARNVLESKGLAVQYKSVAGPARNVGIVDMEASEKEIKVRLRNYQKEPAGMRVSYRNQSKEVSLAPAESALISFTPEKGRGEISLSIADDFKLDNTAYVYIPERATVNALLLTNKESRYLPVAFELIEGVTLERAILPIVQSYDYDLFIFQSIEKDKLLPGTLEAVHEKVINGAKVIIVSQEDLPSTGLAEKFGLQAGQRHSQSIAVQKIDSRLTEGIEFGTVSRFFNATGINPVAYVQAGNSTVTVIGERSEGSGNVLYFGLEEPYSTFHFELMYPVFWKRILEDFFGRLGTEDTNFETGAILTFDSETPVKRPDGSVANAKSIALGGTGFYEVEGKTIAASMASEAESDIGGTITPQDRDILQVKGGEAERKAPYDLTPYLALIAVLLVLGELAVIKYRGDI